MSRYEPFDPQEHRAPAVESETGRERKPEDNSPTAGRGGSSTGEQADSRDRTDGKRNKEPCPRQKHRDRDRTYNLRESEIRTLVEIGSFRAVRTKDLTEFQYRGDEKQSDLDLRNLKSQGLIRQKTLPGTEKEPLLTLSREAHEFLDRNRPQDVPRDQALYHGFVKPREARHDAEVYRLYQKVAKDIESEGGTKLRTVLDFELKKNLYRDLAKLKDMPPEHQAAEKERIGFSGRFSTLRPTKPRRNNAMRAQNTKIGTRAKTRKGRERPHLRRFMRLRSLRASGVAPALSQLRVNSLSASLAEIPQQCKPSKEKRRVHY